MKTGAELGADVRVRKYKSEQRIVATCLDGVGRRPLRLGEWATFRMDIDFFARRYTAFVNGQEFCRSSTRSVNLAGKWNAWGESAGFRVGSGNGGYTTTLFDDIVIRESGRGG